jgi:hypothetical protein
LLLTNPCQGNLSSCDWSAIIRCGYDVLAVAPESAALQSCPYSKIIAFVPSKHFQPDAFLGKSLKKRLTFQGHLLWNAGRTISLYLEERADQLVKDKTVLELGAGAGLPSLVCALNGAAKVVVTDYPDADLIDNLRYNVTNCDSLPDKSRVAPEVRTCGQLQIPAEDFRAIYGEHQQST